jgi:hypothetical protein
MIQVSRPLFPLGRCVATPGALEALAQAGEAAWTYFNRHVRGDWGEVCEEDKHANDDALRNGERLLSAYRTSTGVKVWVITEADRSATTVLLPEEY